MMEFKECKCLQISYLLMGSNLRHGAFLIGLVLLVTIVRNIDQIIHSEYCAQYAVNRKAVFRFMKKKNRSLQLITKPLSLPNSRKYTNPACRHSYFCKQQLPAPPFGQ